MATSWTPGLGYVSKEGAVHVCSSDVPPATGCATMLVWKLSVEVYFDKSSERHLGATLVYMPTWTIAGST
jgi:hypothetical protein